MASYTNEYSKLPFQIMERTYFKDVDDSVADLVNQIKTLQSNGEFNKVRTILGNNPELKKYVISSDYMNAIDEETRNLEILTKSRKQAIFYQSEEPEGITADVWIGDEQP